MLLAAILLSAPPADYDAMTRGLKGALPEGWAFVSGRAAEFAGPSPKVCWLATLEAKKAGDFNFVVEVDHDPAFSAHKHAGSKCEYALSVGKAGTQRSVADPYAAPQCCVGDKLVVPIPVERGDHNHRFTFTPAGKRHLLGHEARDRVIDAKDEAPDHQVDNKASKLLRLVSVGHTTYTHSHVQTRDLFHVDAVILEAVGPGKMGLSLPVEIVPADAALTAWVGAWYQYRGDPATMRYVRGYQFAGPPQWTMRVGDRLYLEFANGPAKAKADPAPPLTIPAHEYAEPKEPYPTVR